jgi:hypothetical protein
MGRNVQIAGVEYFKTSSWKALSIPDSFVVRDNKLSSGNGEAKYYVGGRNDPELRIFFGEELFSINAVLIKEDLVQFLDDCKTEYFKPTQPYQHLSDLPQMWTTRMKTVMSFQADHLLFQCDEQAAGEERCYIKGTKGSAYDLLRELALPNRASIIIEKYRSRDGLELFVFRIRFSTGTIEDRSLIEQSQIQEIESDTNLNETTRKQLILARVGHGKYREGLFASCGAICPFTGIKDERLLVASHAKPWSMSSNSERVDPQNGFVLSPLFDKLFDRGLMTFKDDGEVILSGSLTPIMIGDLEIPEFTDLPLPIFGQENLSRRRFLDFHRRNIFVS